MKKIMGIFVMLMGILFSQTCYAGLNDYPNIAIIPFGNHASVNTTMSSVAGEISLTDAAVASDYVLEALVDSDRFSVLEREQMMAIMSEHHLNLTGMVDQSTAVQIAKLTGVKYLVYGSVTGCSLKTGSIGYDKFGAKKYTVIANVVGRFIDVETGRIVLTARGKGESSSTNMEYTLKSASTYTSEAASTIKFGTENVSQVQVHNAIAKAADDLIYGDSGFLAKLDGKYKRKR